MEATPNYQEEACELADAMYDQRIDNASLERLEHILTNDLASLQAYVERMNFHADMRRKSIESAPLSLAASTMNRARLTNEQRERRRHRAILAASAASLLLFLGMIGWMISKRVGLPPEIGIIAGLTVDANNKSQTNLDLGQIIREGSVIELSTGMASVRLPHTLIDLIAPVKVRISDLHTLELLSGELRANVRRGGEGFSVRTPDSIVVDLGTEFSMNYQPQQGTEVNVRKGRVQASLLNSAGEALKRLELTAERAAFFSQQDQVAREVSYSPRTFQRADQARGTITSIDGTLRLLDAPPASLKTGDHPTPNHMLIIPEQQNVRLESQLQLTGLQGPITLPAGTVVNSYLIHYDPNHLTHFAPRGAVTFDGAISTILVDANELLKTDSLFGLPGTTFEQDLTRDLELDEDEIRISDDRKTVSFYLGVSGGNPLDQARILVISDVH